MQITKIAGFEHDDDVFDAFKFFEFLGTHGGELARSVLVKEGVEPIDHFGGGAEVGNLFGGRVRDDEFENMAVDIGGKGRLCEGLGEECRKPIALLSKSLGEIFGEVEGDLCHGTGWVRRICLF